MQIHVFVSILLNQLQYARVYLRQYALASSLHHDHIWRRIIRVALSRLNDDLCQFDERRPFVLVELKHQPDHFAQHVTILLLDPFDPSIDKLLSIILCALLVEASHVIHAGELVKEETHRENVAFVDVVLGKS